MALTDSLISFWELEEASGTRNDSQGTNHLTDNNTVLSNTGVVGTCADFEQDNDESLTHVDNTDLAVGDIDFTVAFWVKLESKVPNLGNNYQLVNKEDPANGSYEIGWTSVFDRFFLKVFGVSAFGSSDEALSDNFGAPSTGVWCFVVAWHDATANTVNICVNDGAVDSVAHTTGVFNSTGKFSLGRSDPFGSPLDGMMDQVGFWKRVLTSTEITALYNSGNGLSYAAMSGGTLPSGKIYQRTYRPRPFGPGIAR